MRGTAARSLEPSPRIRPGLVAMVTAAVLMLGLVIATVQAPLSAFAAGPPRVLLGAAETYSVLAGDTVTNTGASILNRDLGLSPGSSITGFPPGVVTGGTIHANDGGAVQAHADLAIAYASIAGEASPPVIAAMAARTSAMPSRSARVRSPSRARSWGR